MALSSGIALRYDAKSSALCGYTTLERYEYKVIRPLTHEAVNSPYSTEYYLLNLSSPFPNLIAARQSIRNTLAYHIHTLQSFNPSRMHLNLITKFTALLATINLAFAAPTPTLLAGSLAISPLEQREPVGKGHFGFGGDKRDPIKKGHFGVDGDS